MTDEGIRVLIDIIDKMQTVSLIGFKNTIKEDSVSYDAAITKDDKKQRFIQSAGTIQIDTGAVNDLRERSMI
ncbi:MAG: hypothetical protein K5656_09190 [Lachnospiraceae bacterium]|nr:hypothetical protein [Lachnospiraceae bacterium]